MSDSEGVCGENLLAIRLTGCLLIIAFLVLIVLVVMSPHRFVYDEHFFANYITLFHQYGFTSRFMNSLTGTVGPLYAFVQVVFEPLTQLNPVGMRLVNVFLLLMVAAVLAAWTKGKKRSDYWIEGCSVLVVPMTWVLAGLALSEMSALICVTLSLCLLLRGLESLERRKHVLGWFVTSACLLGISVWGRQPYLLLTGILVLVALIERRARMAALVYMGIVVALAMPLFLIWGGLVPPSHRFVQQGISLTHGVISLGYTGICFMLLAPRCKWLPAKVMMGLALVTAAVNGWFGACVLFPVRSSVDRFVPSSVVAAYGTLCGSLMLSFGVVFLAFLFHTIWRNRGDLKQVAIYAGLLCVAASPVFIAHQYSSRYTAMSLPYLMLAAQPWREQTILTFSTGVVGCGIGFLSLVGYFKS
jgi:hypothetical protein